jgi:hypothetical protein
MRPPRQLRPVFCFLHRADDARVFEESPMGSVIKKRRKKMRKHKQRKLLKRQRHKHKR